MIQVKNTQTIHRLSKKEIIKIAQKVLSYLGKQNYDISLLFCNNQVIQEVNRQYLKSNRATDVIAFNLADKFDKQYLGEIIISVEMAAKNSIIYKTTIKEEIKLYMIHGILHLLGYRDYSKVEQKQMQVKENEILKYLEKNDR
jgi:probable rRNA maturation factor